MVLAYSTCFVGEVRLLVVGEQLGEDEQQLSGVRSSCDMLARNSRLVLGDERQLLGLLFQRGAGLLDLAVLHLDLGVLLLEQLGLLLQLERLLLQRGVGALELFLLLR